jgi:DNA-binding CsgD family transcriptional regulator
MNGPRMTKRRGEKPVTAREKQVVDLVVDGHSNFNIGQLMGISEETVKAHLFHIFNKTGCSSRLQLAMKFGHPNVIDKLTDLKIRQSELAHQLAAVNEAIGILQGASNEEVDFAARARLALICTSPTSC